MAKRIIKTNITEDKNKFVEVVIDTNSIIAAAKDTLNNKIFFHLVGGNGFVFEFPLNNTEAKDLYEQFKSGAI